MNVKAYSVTKILALLKLRFQTIFKTLSPAITHLLT